MELSTTVQAASSSPDCRGRTPEHSWLFPTLAAIIIGLATAVWLRSLDSREFAGWMGPLAVVAAVPAFAALRCTRPPWWGLLGAAAVLRAVFVGCEPWLSDDVFRYLAEGQALQAGENPFVVSPADMTSISEALRARVNHAAFTSIYPPIAMLWFRLTAVFGGTVEAAQVLGLLVDLAIVTAIARAADTRWALVYALHPIGPLEVVLGAHIDGPAVALLAWGCVLTRRMPFFSGVVTALAGGTKLLPFATVSPRRSFRYFTGISAGIFICVVALLPVLDAGSGLLTSLRTYSGHWSFNSLGLTVVEPIAGSWARPILAVLGGSAWLWALANTRRPATTWLVIGVAFIAVTPTVHPWYLLWMVVPALMTRRWKWVAAATPLLGSYAVLWTLGTPTGWHETRALWLATWVPALTVLSLATWLRRKA